MGLVALVQVFAASTGTPLYAYGVKGTGATELQLPQGFGRLSTGWTVVSDNIGKKVIAIDPHNYLLPPGP